MKKNTFLLAIIMFFNFVCFAQTNKEEAIKELNKKAIKMVRKEAKNLKKEGWAVDPGSLPMEKQLESYYVSATLVNEDGSKKFIEATVNEKDRIKQNADDAAMQTAGYKIASIIQSNVYGYIEGNAAKSDLSKEDLSSIREFTKNSITLIQAELGYIDPVVKLSRKIDNDQNYEVQLKVLYNTNQARKAAENVIINGLKEKLKINDEKLRKIIGVN